MQKLANIRKTRINLIMRRSITYAELLLILILLPAGYVGVNNIYEFITDRITIEVHFKK